MDNGSVDKVAAFIREQKLLDKGKRYLVALSGGADSVTLLHILLQLGYEVEAVHCNFRLRGDESDRDEAFVVSLCQRLCVALHRIHFDTRTYAGLHQMSIEMAARELRYSYFEQLLHDIGAEAVCVAHHRDDAVETLLMNLMRGAGIHGLTGIRPRRDDGKVVRPLLCLSRQEIEKYLDSIGEDYVTDSSNLVADVRRNQIRLNVIPLLEQIFPLASEKIALAANHLAEVERVYDFSMESAKKRLWHDNSIAIDELLAEASPKTVLYELLRPMGFSSVIAGQLFNSLYTASTGRIFSSDSHDAVIDRCRIVVTPRQPQPKPLSLPEPGLYRFGNDAHIRVTIAEGAEISREPLCATLDADKVGFPLTVRPVQRGDRFIPFGMKGSRLVSDYLTDRKLPLTEKRRQLLVTESQGDIVWLVGHRTDHRYRIDDTTRHTLKLEMSV